MRIEEGSKANIHVDPLRSTEREKARKRKRVSELHVTTKPFFQYCDSKFGVDKIMQFSY